MRSLLRLLALVCALAWCFASASPAHAGGFDTPILYSARHMGMGGTAIGYVYDPSAMFHNPAGLSGIEGLSVLGDVSPIFGKISSSPGGSEDATPDANNYYKTRTSELIVAPAFLLGAGYRMSERLVLGFALYPVASASGEYRATMPNYTTGDQNAKTINKTSLRFIEASPGLSFELIKGLSLGVGWRITLAELERVQGYEADPTIYDFKASGIDLKGVRVGAMWRINEHGSLGLVYRHRIEPKVTADKGVAGTYDLRDLETTFVLPAKLGLGGRTDWGNFGAALDLEYGFYSQNDRTVLKGYNPQLKQTWVVDNVFEWQNAITARLGLEYRVNTSWPVRLGYVYDGKVGSVHYPSAFGTPPAASHSFTAGAGYRAERWQLNVATAFRTASTQVTPRDTDDDLKSDNGQDRYPCATCSKAGSDYSLALVGAYLDFSYQFDVKRLF